MSQCMLPERQAQVVQDALRHVGCNGCQTAPSCKGPCSVLREGLGCAQAFRGFAGTSILILVGVATDTARRVKAEQAMQRYKDYDRLYDDM